MVPGPPRSTSYSFESTTSANTGLSSMTNSFYSPGINSPAINNMKGLSSANGRSHLSLTVNTMAGGYPSREIADMSSGSASGSPRYARDFNPTIAASGRFPGASDDLVFNKAASGMFGR